MSKLYGIVTLSDPSGLTATLVEGGSLSPNTTYYYKIVHAKAFISSCFTWSKRSETVSITTTDTHRSVKLDWNDPGSGIQTLFLRNTSDYFGDDIDCCIGSASGNHVPSYVTSPTTTFTDTGAYGVDGTIDWKTGCPTIWCYATAGETITMANIYDYDVSQG